MIPRPEDIPDCDTKLTPDELRTVLQALDPKIPWTPADVQNGRRIGTYSSDDSGAMDRFMILTSYGWDIRFFEDQFASRVTVHVFKLTKT